MNRNQYLKVLITLLSLSIIYVLLYTFVLIDIPAKFPKGYEIGILLNALALSIISATIFYFIIDYFPKKSRKKKLLKVLQVHLTRMEYNFKVILENLDYLENEEVLTVENATRENLREVMTRTVSDFPTEQNVLEKNGLNISELIMSREGLINEQIEELQKHSEILSPELYEELTELKLRDFSKITRGFIISLNKNNYPFPNLRVLSDEFYKTILNMRNIKKLWSEQ